MKELLLALNERPIAYYRIYTKLLGSTPAGILLSQVMYWWAAVKGCEFHKVDEEILEETALTPSELRAAKKILKESGFVTIKAKGVPARTHYQVNHQILQTSLVNFTKLNSLNSPNLNSEFHQTITENTTENTSERRDDAQSAAPAFSSPVNDKPKKTRTITPRPGIDILTDAGFRREMADRFPLIPVSRELDKMIDYLAAKGKTHKDYAAAARNWLRNAEDFARRDGKITAAPQAGKKARSLAELED